MVEQLICNQQAGGSTPLIGSFALQISTVYVAIIIEVTGRFPSGQRGQTVNLLAKPSEVQILPSPLHGKRRVVVLGGNSSVG